MPHKYISVFVTALSLAVLPVIAQTVEGSISGAVVDQTGSVIPAASVEILNQDTHLTRTAATSGIGTFTVPLLRPGLYTLSVFKDGFGRSIKKDVQVQVSQSVTV